MKEHPVLILRNADGTAIQALGFAYNLKLSIRYNETSSISFDVPAYVDGVKTPCYDDIIGMRIVDVLGYGQFVLVNPSVSKTGDKEIKSCTGYSLEYELTYKKFSIEEGTYSLWNPAAPEDTVIGMILDVLPSWSVGEIDTNLIGKYRTFSVENVNVYNFIKSTLQTTYNCIFDFDTYERKINIRSVENLVITAPVYISLDNLAREIKVNEDTENIFTCLDVNGADGVDIRIVNPLGTNKIYNLDYFMNLSHFSNEMIDKWNSWKTSFKSNQMSYFNKSVELSLKNSAILTETSSLSDEKDNDLATLMNRQSVYIEYMASLSDDDDEYEEYARKLSDVSDEIDEMEDAVAEHEALIDGLNADKESLLCELSEIRTNVSFSNFFSDAELIVLDRYVKEDSISESSFAVSNVEAYTGAGTIVELHCADTEISGGDVTKILGVSGKDLFNISGGHITLVDDNMGTLDAEIISLSAERKEDGSFVLSSYLGKGTIGEMSFINGCVSATGTSTAFTTNAIPDEDAPDSYWTGSSLLFSMQDAKMYFTKNTTEYERYSVAWDLYDYGEESIRKLSYPSFNFDVSSANFFALDEFEAFVRNIALGKKLYLDMDNGYVLEPILIGVDVNFEDLSSLTLKFGDKYSASNSAFELVDLLEQSVSMGKTVDTDRMSYNAFIDSGASTSVKTFMESALDVSKNAILSGENMAISWDSSGIRCRKSDNSGGFSDEQLAIINNSICFTDDSWKSSKMAIGKFKDSTLGDCWGVVAPNIVGTLLAGNNLVIESELESGGTSVFKVDANGAVLHNARFDIDNGTSHIVLDPMLGFGIGDYPVIETVDSEDAWNEDRAKFWVDSDGNVHMKGKLEGCDGLFTGSMTVGGEDGFRVDNIGNLSIGGTATHPNFHVSADGTMTAKSGSFNGRVDASSMYINGENILTNTDTDGMATSTSKISSTYLNLGNIQLDGATGNITLGGNIYISGNIQWNATNTPVVAMYSRTSVGNPKTSSNWHNTFATGDVYVSYSYDGGTTWTTAIKTVGNDGYDGVDGDDANVDAENVFNALTSDGSMYGCFYDDNGRLYINAEYIHSGTIDADVVQLAGESGKFCCQSGNDGAYTTDGAMMCGSRNDYYFIATDRGVRMTAGDYGGEHLYCVVSGVHASSELIVDSDKRVKNTISYDMGRYDGFFRSLRPAYYKMNNGKSGRFHIGYIAQDVETSLSSSGLTNIDFAGLTIYNTTDRETGEEIERYGLRYSDFISLNTYQIQRLMDRVERLEYALESKEGL